MMLNACSTSEGGNKEGNNRTLSSSSCSRLPVVVGSTLSSPRRKQYGQTRDWTTNPARRMAFFVVLFFALFFLNQKGVPFLSARLAQRVQGCEFAQQKGHKQGRCLPSSPISLSTARPDKVPNKNVLRLASNKVKQSTKGQTIRFLSLLRGTVPRPVHDHLAQSGCRLHRERKSTSIVFCKEQQMLKEGKHKETRTSSPLVIA